MQWPPWLTEPKGLYYIKSPWLVPLTEWSLTACYSSQGAHPGIAPSTSFGTTLCNGATQGPTRHNCMLCLGGLAPWWPQATQGMACIPHTYTTYWPNHIRDGHFHNT